MSPVHWYPIKTWFPKDCLKGMGFLQIRFVGSYNMKTGKTLQSSGHSLIFKYANIHDIKRIRNYLDGSEVYSKMDGRYFNEWKFYKLKNTFDGVYDLISKGKLFLIVDEDNKINGLSVINIMGNKDLFYNKPLLQICYLDCLDYFIYPNFVYLIMETLGAPNQIKNIHFFVENSIDLTYMFNDICIDNCEEFIIYSKKLT